MFHLHCWYVSDINVHVRFVCLTFAPSYLNSNKQVLLGPFHCSHFITQQMPVHFIYSHCIKRKNSFPKLISHDLWAQLAFINQSTLGEYPLNRCRCSWTTQHSAEQTTKEVEGRGTNLFHQSSSVSSAAYKIFIQPLFWGIKTKTEMKWKPGNAVCYPNWQSVT